MTYVDGYLLPVKKKDLSAYKKLAKVAAKIWMKCGALGVYECQADDLTSVKKWKGREFPKMVKIKPGETIFYSFILYKSKAHRDSVNKKVTKEMVKDKDKWKDKKMPFDMKRMAFGGFKAVVEEKSGRK